MATSFQRDSSPRTPFAFAGGTLFPVSSHNLKRQDFRTLLLMSAEDRSSDLVTPEPCDRLRQRFSDLLADCSTSSSPSVTSVNSIRPQKGVTWNILAENIPVKRRPTSKATVGLPDSFPHSVSPRFFQQYIFIAIYLGANGCQVGVVLGVAGSRFWSSCRTVRSKVNIVLLFSSYFLNVFTVLKKRVRQKEVA